MRLYNDLADSDRSRVLTNDQFGYWAMTVERPLRLNFTCTPERIERAIATKPLKSLDLDALRECLEAFGTGTYMNREAFLKDLNPHLRDHGISLSTPQRKTLWMALGEHDDNADICYDKHGDPEPDTNLRDTENVAFTFGGNARGADGRDDTIQAYFDNEVQPHLPDAWMDAAKTKVGYEIPFARIFYKYQPPRSLEAIDADLEARIARVLDMLREVEA